MKSSSFTAGLSTNSLTSNMLRKGVLRQLAHLRHGQLIVYEGDDRHIFGAAGATIQGEIHVQDQIGRAHV